MTNISSEIEWLKSKVKENPASMLYARLADRYLQMHEIDQAIEYAEKGAVLHPNYATIKYVLAKCYYERREYDSANRTLKEAIAVDPNFLSALNLQTELLQNLGQISAIESNYNRMLSIDPINNEILNKLDTLKSEQVLSEASFSLDETEPEERPEFTPADDWGPELSDALFEVDKKFDDNLLTETIDAGLLGGGAESTETISDETTLQEKDDFQDDTAPFEDLLLDESPVQETKKDTVLNLGMEAEFDQDTEAIFADESEKELLESPVDDEMFEDSSSELGFDFESKDVATESIETEFNAEPDVSFESEEDTFSNREQFQTDNINHKVLDETVEDDFEVDREKYQKEETRFTQLLDDIFSSGVDEEERIEEERRNEIERIASETESSELEKGPKPFSEEDWAVLDKVDEKFEPLQENNVVLPEEKIMSTEIEDDFADLEAEMDSAFSDDENLPDEFVSTAEDFESAISRPQQDVVEDDVFGEKDIDEFEKDFDQPEVKIEEQKTEESAEDLNNFLASLDIKEEPLPSIGDVDLESSDMAEPMESIADQDMSRKDFSPEEDLSNDDLLDMSDDFVSDLSSSFGEKSDDDISVFDDNLPSLDDSFGLGPSSDEEMRDKSKQLEPESKETAGDESGKKFVTPTLGEIYAAQGQYAKAISVYETLLKNQPDNEWYQSKVDYLKKKLQEQQGKTS